MHPVASSAFFTLRFPNAATSTSANGPVGFALSPTFRSISCNPSLSATLSDIIVSRFSVLCPGFTTLEPHPSPAKARIADSIVFAHAIRVPSCTPSTTPSARTPSIVTFASLHALLTALTTRTAFPFTALTINASRNNALALAHALLATAPRSSRVISRATSSASARNSSRPRPSVSHARATARRVDVDASPRNSNASRATSTSSLSFASPRSIAIAAHASIARAASSSLVAARAAASASAHRDARDRASASLGAIM